MEEYRLTDAEFVLFRDLVYKQTGIALSDAKRQLVRSRLQKRLRHHGLTRYRDYFDLVTSRGDDSEEMRALINCITTNKTEFFREAHHFQFIAANVLPHLIGRGRSREAPRRIRIWHAGCSTGEEPYTMAMVLATALEQDAAPWDARLLASDIDTGVLEHAKAGIYDEERVAPVPPDMLRRFFLRGCGDKSGLYRVRPDLCQLIAFRRINLLDEEWPIRSDTAFDIIFCRNVMIYFDRQTQRRLCQRFAEVLKPGGYLFVGHSETLVGAGDVLEPLGQTIYRVPDRGATGGAHACG